MSNSYWIDRLVKTQNAIADKTIEDIQRQLKKYYKDAMEQVISDFEATYDKLLATVEDGREPTPADLYKLDKYWQMQAQLKNEMQALGDKEIALLSEKFEKEWNDVYESFALTSKNSFSTISTRNAKAAINTAWLSDGKNFSQRVWNNTNKLVETLNDNLINCVITGKKTTELKQLLQKRFNVSYNAADMLVRTETAHIQTQAAAQRYKDYGLKEYEFLADPDERTCSVCAALDGKRFLLSEMKPGVNAPPMHPRDRCCIVPVVNKETEEEIMEKEITSERLSELKERKVKYEKEIEEITSKYNPEIFNYVLYRDNNYGLTEEEIKAIIKINDLKRRIKDVDEWIEAEKLNIKEKIIEQELREKVIKKFGKIPTKDDPYTTVPLQKRIKEAKTSEGKLVYNTIHCPHCGGYFNTTSQNKTKCPLCGEKFNGKLSYADDIRSHVIQNKRCTICGKLFIPDYDEQIICDDCKNSILTSKEAERLKKKGYTNDGVIKELTGQEPEIKGFYYRENLKKSDEDKYFEYVSYLHNVLNVDEDYYPDINEVQKHIAVCIDCGRVFHVDTKNNAAKRCPKCQAEYRRKYKAEKEKERRKKKKYNG